MRAGSNGSKASTFSPVPANLTGWPVTAAAESAAPPRESPSSLVSTMPVMPTLAVELGCALHRVLAGERVGHVQHLGRLGELALLGELGHQLVVDVQPAGGVDDQRVVPDGARLGERLLQQLAGRSRARGGGPRTLGLRADRAQLLAGGRALDVGRHQQRVAPAALEPAAELGRRGGLARALEARHQDHARQPRLDHTSGRGSAPPSTSTISSRTMRSTAWSGVRLFRIVLAHRTRAHALDELLGDAEVDVGLEEREADLAQRGVDLGLAEDTLPAEGPEDPLEPFAERLEHADPPPAGLRPSQSKT